MTFGQWSSGTSKLNAAKLGKPISPRSKSLHLATMCAFFRDCQEWGWLPRRFDPRRSFSPQRPIRVLIAPNLRVISDDVWAKLLWAGLNLTTDDLLIMRGSNASRPPKFSYYPLEMVRALATVWLFAGLRSNEIMRLRVGCVRLAAGECSHRWRKRGPTERCRLPVGYSHSQNRDEFCETR